MPFFIKCHQKCDAVFGMGQGYLIHVDELKAIPSFHKSTVLDLGFEMTRKLIDLLPDILYFVGLMFSL